MKQGQTKEYSGSQRTPSALNKMFFKEIILRNCQGVNRLTPWAPTAEPTQVTSLMLLKIVVKFIIGIDKSM